MIDRNKIRIYLAGTIYDEEPANTWKQRLVNGLQDSETESMYEVFDPDPCAECDLSMVARDKAEIEHCDIFVAYIEQYTVGTSMEIYHAFLRNNIPIIVICPNHIVEGNIWIEAHVHLIFTSVEGAVKHIKSMRF
jgi:nucleoside 2-deoxyribosyltransferase